MFCNINNSSSSQTYPFPFKMLIILLLVNGPITATVISGLISFSSTANPTMSTWISSVSAHTANSVSDQFLSYSTTIWCGL